VVVAVAAWRTELQHFEVQVEWQSFDQRPLLGLEWTVVAAVVAVVAAAVAAAVVDQRSRLVP